ncbi:TPA: hypothetical protein ACKE1E_005488, partial [Raoultella ornithinolytica]
RKSGYQLANVTRSARGSRIVQNRATPLTFYAISPLFQNSQPPRTIEPIGTTALPIWQSVAILSAISYRGQALHLIQI